MVATIYTTSTCSYCTQVKKFLTHKGVSYEEKNADDPTIRDEAIQVSGAMTVPITVINGQTIVGWQPAKLVQAIAG